MARFSDSLIRKLNKACEKLSESCDMSCGKIGWCEACWDLVKGKRQDEQKGGAGKPF